MNLTEAYKTVYYGEEDLLMDLIELCSIYEFFDTEEDAIFFAEELIDQNLCGEFLNGLAEVMEIDSSYYLTEQNLTENRGAALRNVINALSTAGRAKAGLKPGTALATNIEKTVKGAAASASIRSARKAKIPVPVEKPGKYALMQFKKGIEKAVKTPALPPAKPAAATPKPPAKPAAQPKLKGWDAHKQALDNTKTFLTAFVNTYMKPAAKKVKGAAADPWKQFPGKRQPQRGLPKTGPSSALPTTKALPSSGMRGVQGVRSGQGSSAGVRSITVKDPYPANLQKPAPKPKFGKATDIGAPETPTKYMKLTTPKATPAPKTTPAPKQVAPKANRMTGGADALNKARRALAGAAAGAVAAGAAAPLVKDTSKKSDPSASIGKYNTKDADGTIRNRLKVGPKIVGTGSVAGDFDVAFKKARTSGAKEFEFQGKKYNTKLKNEEVDYFDLVMDHLISEGYVDTTEDALVMMTALDENVIAKMAAGLIKNVIKSGGAKLTKTALPPKMDPALKAVKDSIKKQYGAGSLVGTSEYKYASAARKAELAKNPPAKPKARDQFPGDVYSRSDFGIRGYRSGD